MTLHRVSKEQRRDIDRKLQAVSKLVNWQGGSLLNPEKVARDLGMMLAEAPPPEAPQGSTTPKEAGAIMGPAFHGPDALKRHFGAWLEERDKGKLELVPFAAELLEQCKRTHILVAGAHVSIMGMRAAAPSAFYFNKAWYADEEFANEVIKTSWYLVRRDAVAGSTSKLWTEQQNSMPGEEYTPKACAVVLAVILHYLETKERLMQAVYVRTDDVDSCDRRVSLGRFGEHGLRIQSRGESVRDYHVGAAGARWTSWSHGGAPTSKRQPRKPPIQRDAAAARERLRRRRIPKAPEAEQEKTG